VQRTNFCLTLVLISTTGRDLYCPRPCFGRTKFDPVLQRWADGRRVGEGKRVGSMWRVVYSVGADHRVRENTVKGRGREL
jgi:hypothetical protein